MSDEEAAVLAANAAYYEAFATSDFAAMSEIWARDQVSCIHPGWPALVGRDAVLRSYKDILGNPRQERIAFRDALAFTAGEVARVLCTEFVGDAALAATNCFHWFGDGWRIVHHQASPVLMAAQPRGMSLH
jgi:ketosteroid isomerase-like protein